MKNYKLVIAYDGSRYHGWESKKNQDTIQGKLEEVLQRMSHQEVKVIGAGRTDARVHARAMVANVHMETGLSAEEIRDYMNRYLPDDIAVTEVKEASERFHARYNAAGKTYQYRCYEGSSKPIFDRRYVTILGQYNSAIKAPVSETDQAPRLNLQAMKQAAAYLLGQHDFMSFCANAKMKKSTVRTIDRIEIDRQGDYILMSFHGDGFLQNMVRIMAGTLIEVGYGRISAEQIPEILQGRQRSLAGPTAPAQGLCLMEIDY